MTPKERGAIIRAARKSKKLTQEAVGRKVGVSQTTVSDIERGESDDPGGQVMRGIADLLGLDFTVVTQRRQVKPQAPAPDPAPDHLQALQGEVDLLKSQLILTNQRQDTSMEQIKKLIVKQSTLGRQIAGLQSEVRGKQPRGRKGN